MTSSALPLRRIAAEGFVIVASILLAFALDAWWDERNEAVAEQEILSDLRRDFEASREWLEDRSIPLHRAALTGVRDLLWWMTRGTAPSEAGADTTFTGYLDSIVLPIADASGGGEFRPVQIPDSIVGAALFTATYDPTLSSLEALLSSGSLSKISNPELRAMLAEFPAQLADLADEERLARNHAYTVLRPLLHRHMNAVAAEMVGYAWGEGDDELPRYVTERRSELRGSTALANTLAARFTAQVGVLSEAGDLLREMDQVLALLDLELAGAAPEDG